MDVKRKYSRRTGLKAGAAVMGGMFLGRLGTSASFAGEVLGTCSGNSTMGLRSAARADSLVDIMGVRTTLYASATAYGNVPLVLNAVRDDAKGLGIRHLREAIILPSVNATMASKQRAAWPQFAALGIDFTSVIGDPDDSDGTVAAYASYIKEYLGGNSGLVSTVENSNEPNDTSSPWNKTNPDGWIPLVRARQQQMATVFRNDPALNRIKLAGPTITGGAGIAKYQQLGDLSPNIDLGNFHYYSGNRKLSTPAAELDDILMGLSVNAPGKSVICTETGMHQANYATSPMAPTPEDVAGVYMPRVALEHYFRGINRVFEFELFDDVANPSFSDQEAHFGLLRYNTKTLDKKPAYLSLKRLLDLLREPGASFEPEGLYMQVTGAPDDYRQILFEKSDGRRYLCMWRDVSIWDQVLNKPINVPIETLTLTLSTPADIKLYRPSKQVLPDATYEGVTTLDIALVGSVIVLEISH